MLYLRRECVRWFLEIHTHSQRATSRFIDLLYYSYTSLCLQAPCIALAAFVESSHLNCTTGLESVRYCRPEGGEDQPTLFFCANCSMTCWKLDKVSQYAMLKHFHRNGRIRK